MLNAAPPPEPEFDWSALNQAVDRGMARLRFLLGDAERCLKELRRDYDCLAVAARSFERPAAERLTHQEHRVAMLLVAGHTDAETAAMLGISVYTAKTHVKNILRKLGLRSRWQLAAALIGGAEQPLQLRTHAHQ